MIHAFIFARGGSKGLPGKNTRMLCGKPLLAWAIEQAKSIDRINAVTVSSDDDVILAIADKFGALCLKRPAHLAADDSQEWLSWQHAVTQTMMGAGDIFVSLPATSPLRKCEDIEVCIDAVQLEAWDAAITVHRAKGVRFGNRDEWVRRQDSNVYDIAGSVYAAKAAFISIASSLATGHICPVEVERGIDIDTLDDFNVAEEIMHKRLPEKDYYKWAI